ncbi:MAG TPA: aminoacyl-tRNA hydrolase [Candidatus Paceibacterota bacterium]
MAYVIVGLGNPGEEYEITRHNTGKIIAERLGYKTLDEFMNNSGPAVAKAMAGKKASKLVIIHDDLDLALGTFKISFNKGPGGHRGVGSIIKVLKTQEFIRIRVGISPATPSGKLKKPTGEKKVLDFILGKFKPKELEVLKKLSKKIGESISLIVSDGVQVAMNHSN